MDVTIAGVDRSSAYTPEELAQITVRLVADRGEVGTASVPIPDPAGTQEPYAGQQFLLEVGAVEVFNGYVGSVDRNRNGTIGNRLLHHYYVSDENAALDGYVAIWKRPAETDRARILAFNAAFLGHLSLDTTWVLNSNLVTVPAKQYSTESLFSELQDDLEPASGKTLFIERGRLHWHLPTQGITAGLAIVEAEDADYVTSFPLLSANPPSRAKDPMELATKVTVRNSKGQARSASDSTAITRHDADGLRHHVLLEEPDATTAQLQALANATLAGRKRERITYEGEIGPLTASQLEDIPVGALIPVTDHVWGLTASTQRIAAEDIRYVHPNRFYVGLELGYPVRIRRKPPRLTPPAPLRPFVPDGGEPWALCTPVGLTGAWTYDDPGSFNDDGTVSGTVGTLTMEDPTIPPWTNASWTWSKAIPAGARPFEVHTMWSLPEVGTDVGVDGTTSLVRMHLNGTAYVQAAIVSVDDYGVPGEHEARFKGATGSDIIVDLGVGGTAAADADLGFRVDASGAAWGRVILGASDSGWVSLPWTDLTVDSILIYALFGGVDFPDPGGAVLSLLNVTIDQDCGSAIPLTGQTVADPAMTGDGATTTYVTAYPYIAGSLRLDVDGIDWTTLVTETDPGAGTYDLTYAPPVGATVTVYYVAA